MLFPRPIGFKFYRDSVRFIAVLAGIAGLGFCFSAVQFVRMGVSTLYSYSYIFLRHKNEAQMAHYRRACAGPNHCCCSSRPSSDTIYRHLFCYLETPQIRHLLHISKPGERRWKSQCVLLRQNRNTDRRWIGYSGSPWS